MIKKTYNLKHITSIEVIDKVPSDWYFYKKEKKLLGITIRKEGIYQPSFWLDLEFISKEVPKGLTLIDGVIFDSPCVVIRFLKERSRVFTFKTLTECEFYATSIKHDAQYTNEVKFASL